MALIEYPVCRHIGGRQVKDGCYAGRDDTAANSGLLAALDDSSGAIDGRWDQLFLVVRMEKGRSQVNHVGGALDGVNQGSLVEQVSLNELELSKQVPEGLANRRNLRLVVLIADRASDAESTIFEEHLAGLGTNIPSDAGKGD